MSHEEYTPLPRSGQQEASQAPEPATSSEYTKYPDPFDMPDEPPDEATLIQAQLPPELPDLVDLLPWSRTPGGPVWMDDEDLDTEEELKPHFCHLNAEVVTTKSAKTRFGREPEYTRITVAYSFDDEINVLRFGVAFCSPTDNFCKAKGRKIALERLASPDHDTYFMRTDLYHVDIKELLSGLVETAVNNGGDLLGIPNSWEKVFCH